MANMANVECSECGKEIDAPDPETSEDDCLQVECPHCGRGLMLDRVSYWVASGLGDT